MPKVTRKRKAEAEVTDTGGSIFDHFARQNEDLNGSVEKTNVAEKPDASAELLKQIADLNARVEQAERTNLALLSAPPKVAEVAPRHEEPKDDELPDPTMDPGGYARAVSERAERRIQNFMAEQERKQQADNQSTNSAKDLWTDFASQYEDYAEDEERVSFATAQVMKDLKAKGIDVARYTTTARDKFFKDVTTRMDKIFGKPGEEADDNQEEVPNRTAGIFGGLESGGKPSKHVDQPGDMIKDLHDLQRKSGFY